MAADSVRLTFAAVGAAATAWWPRAVVGAFGLIAVVNYLTWELVPLLK